MLDYGSVGRDLQYFILPGPHFYGASQPHLMSQNLYQINKFYHQWKISWAGTFKELKSQAEPNSNEFIRQTILTGIAFKDEIIAFETMALFDLRLDFCLEHPYIKRFPAEFIHELVQNKIYRLLSIEYLYVKPEWRKKFLGVCLSEALCCLCVRISGQMGVDGALAVPRNDRKVSSFFYERGARCVATAIPLHNVTVDLFSVDSTKFNFDLGGAVDQLIRDFWINKMDGLQLNAKQSAA